MEIKLLNNPWVKQEASNKIIFFKNIEINENKNKTYENMWDASSAKSEIIALNVYEEQSQINNLP